LFTEIRRYMHMERTRKLVLILEGLAIGVAVVLILVDYKLKNDLVDLYKKMEGTLERGRQSFGETASTADSPSGVHTGSLVDNVARLETSAYAGASNGDSPAKANSRTPADRRKRIGDPQIPESGKQMGS
jgi:hypothetical protein